MTIAPHKIAMWSGPRNLSTAMMYSFGNRADCAISDEPFYAAYLAHSGVSHPMQVDILASQPNDPEDVIGAITGPNPGGAPIWYQKHMTHHMLPDFPLDWLAGFTNVFLIRHPARVIASYTAKRENPTLDDLGFVQQLRLFEHCRALGQDPVVIDCDEILTDPERTLGLLCRAIGIEFDPNMLNWSAGPRAEDGIWARHWYGSVHASTGFGEAPGPLPEPQEVEIYQPALGIYNQLKTFTIVA